MQKHLKTSDYISMPWKNGLGTTLELAVSLHDADQDSGLSDSPFLWRISIASVTEDGAFSYFKNIDRNLTLLQGAGMVLDVDGQESLRLDKPLQSVTFSGEADVSAQLHDGPITDFNVMVDQRFKEAMVEALLVEDKPVGVLLGEGINFLHVPEASPSLILFIDQKDIRMEPGESYLFKGADQCVAAVQGGNEPAFVIVVKISRIVTP